MWCHQWKESWDPGSGRAFSTRGPKVQMLKPYNHVMCSGVRTPLPVRMMGDRQSCGQGEPNSLPSLWLLASLEDLPHLRKPCLAPWPLTWAETSWSIFPGAVLSWSPEPLDSNIRSGQCGWQADCDLQGCV